MKNIVAIIIVFLLLIPSIGVSKIVEQVEKQITITVIPMDSPWPMKCHDLHHTGRSPYSTADNNGAEKWRFKTGGWIEGGPVIDDKGIIYVGDFDRYLYAVYPNGTLKWKYKTDGWIWSTPAISEDGTIYIGSQDCRLHALNPNGTLKWKCSSGGGVVWSSPAIGEDGTIYFGTMRGFDMGDIVAVYPNGTKKWIYTTGYFITSDPAIGDDGTVYIGSMDRYLYAMYPNGTLRWRFKTGDEIHSHPSIAEDGTIYIGSNDDYLYALYPNGTMKWKFNTGWGTYASASIGVDGTIYVTNGDLYAVYPNSTLKWKFDFGSNRDVGHASPAIGADGTIYVGVRIGEGSGGEIIAVNPDGTERWRKKIANFLVESSPCIGEDGTVYIGSSWDDPGNTYGYLHAFSKGDVNQPPSKPMVDGPTSGKVNTEYTYVATAVDPDGDNISFLFDWRDGTDSRWTAFVQSGTAVNASHVWNQQGTYNIRVKAKDDFGSESEWAILIVSMPRNKVVTNSFFIKLFERFIHKN